MLIFLLSVSNYGICSVMTLFLYLICFFGSTNYSVVCVNDTGEKLEQTGYNEGIFPPTVPVNLYHVLTLSCSH